MKSGTLGGNGDKVHDYWWDVQSKQIRQIYRQSIQTDRRQFTKRYQRSVRPRQYVTNELRNVCVKLN